MLLRLIASLLLAASVLSCPRRQTPEEATRESVYHNAAMGFRITKPQGWFFAPYGWSAQNVARIRLPDTALVDLLKAHAGPIVAFTDNLHPAADVSATVQVTYRPLSAKRALRPGDYLDVALAELAFTFENFSTTQLVKHLVVSGFPAAYAQVTYSPRTEAGSFDVVSHLWLVKRSHSIFTIGMAGPASRTAELDPVFDTILGSIAIERPLD